MSPLIAASAILSLNPGKWFRLLHLTIFFCIDLNYPRIYTYATVLDPGSTLNAIYVDGYIHPQSLLLDPKDGCLIAVKCVLTAIFLTVLVK